MHKRKFSEVETVSAADGEDDFALNDDEIAKMLDEAPEVFPPPPLTALSS